VSVTVLKLGGSVITEKDSPETVDERRLEEVVEALEGAEELVLVHGGGSFGHHNAAAHGVSQTEGTYDHEGILAIHRAMIRLNDRVVDALQGRRVPALPVHPLSAGYRDRTGTLVHPLSGVATMVDEGFVPVLHGDVIVQVGAGATVVSGDDIVVALAEGLDADRVGLCSTVPGVLDTDGDVIDRIDRIEDVRAILGGSKSTDVTGGMAAKVEKLLTMDAPASIFGPESIDAFLAGDAPGTLIE
jgi:isopentenyl phosphate kinase